MSTYEINKSVVHGTAIPNYSNILENISVTTIYYLMVKTHNKTGLKYLCQTTRCDYEKYQGSGIYWDRHITKHGYDVTTRVIQRCYTKSALKAWGIFYSELWSVVDSNKWANLKPEEGQGGWGGKQNPNNLPGAKERQSAAMSGDKNPIHLPGVKDKVQQNTKTAMWRSDVRENLLAGINSKSWKDARAKRVGTKSPNFDNTIFEFEHKDGTVEMCTQYELRNKYEFSGASMSLLIKGKSKTCHGWRLVRVVATV